MKEENLFYMPQRKTVAQISGLYAGQALVSVPKKCIRQVVYFILFIEKENFCSINLQWLLYLGELRTRIPYILCHWKDCGHSIGYMWQVYRNNLNTSSDILLHVHFKFLLLSPYIFKNQMIQNIVPFIPLYPYIYFTMWLWAVTLKRFTLNPGQYFFY